MRDNDDKREDEEKDEEEVELEPQAYPPYKMKVTWVNDGRRY